MTTRLPVVGSTAATTAFCSARIDGPGGLHLYVDGNGKITRDEGTLDAPRPNAFSLVQVQTCPGSTEACRASCYVHNLEAAQKSTHDLYVHNTSTIATILADDALAGEWAMTFAAWLNANVKSFRWHVSGDVFSLAYAEWIRDVCRESPGVSHWIYTRSFGFLAPLAEVSTLRGGNLAINLSADRDNYEKAQTASVEHGRKTCMPVGGDPAEPVEYDEEVEPLRICYLTVDGKVPDDLGPDDVIFPDYHLRPRAAKTLAESEWWQSISQFNRGLVCPIDAHGKAENRRCGPCSRCLT